MRQIIKKIEPSCFSVWWDNLPESKLIINFTPIIKHFNLQNHFVLAHWQSRPKGLRRWGLYDGISDNYYGADWDKIQTENPCNPLKFLQIDETKLTYPPSAVVLFNHSRIHYLGSNRLLIKRNN